MEAEDRLRDREAQRTAMWMLIVPLVMGDMHRTYEAQYATAEACEAARIELVRRVEDARAIPFSGVMPGRWPITEQIENEARVDQPPGWPDGWAYVNSERVGYCSNEASVPSARGRN